VYFPYFAVDVTYDDEHARRSLQSAGVEVPPIESYFDKLLGYAVAADWGRSPLTRAAAWKRLDGDGRGHSPPARKPVLSGA
jgi:hypothetical protein